MKLKNHFFLVIIFITFTNFFEKAKDNSFTIESTSSASTFGIKADLEYLDVVLGLDNKVTKVIGSFTSNDVGKFLAIKKGHYNASDSLTGDVIPFTPKGRLVTATVYIASVSNGEATVEVVNDGSLLDTGIILNQDNLQIKRAYMYTNNFDAIRSAMESCYSNGVEVLDFDLDGIVGINPFYGTNYVNNKKALVFKSSIGNLEILSSNNARLKICTEYGGHVEHKLFTSDQGNGNITIDIPCVPPDLSATRWGLTDLNIFDGNYLENHSGNSVRKIDLKNLTFDAADVDGNDSYWSGIYTNSLGGVSSSEVQTVRIKNVDIQTKHSGISIFSQNGPTNEEHLKNVTLNFILHYNGENGRSFVGGDKKSSPGQWRFDASKFTLNGDILEVNNPDMDFSFYDYPDHTRTMYFIFNGSSYTLDLTWSGMTAHKAKLKPTTESIPWGEAGSLVIKFSRDTFGHPHYVHPNVSFVLNNVISKEGFFRYYSSGGQVGTPAFNIIKNSKINNLEFNNSGASNGAHLELDNSKVGFYLTNLSKLTLKNASITKGYTNSIDEFDVIGTDNTILHGGHIRGMQNITITGNKFQLASQGLHFSYKDAQGVDQPVNVTLDQTDFLGGSLPIVKNGTLTIKNSVAKEDVWMNSSFDQMTSNTSVLFENVYLNGDVASRSWFESGFYDVNVAFDEFVFSNTEGNRGLSHANFSNTSKYNGIFSVTESPTEAERDSYTVSDAYNGLPYFMGRKDVNILGCDVLLTNKCRLREDFASNFVIASFVSQTPTNISFFTKIDLANNAYVNGDVTFDIILEEGANINPFYKKSNPFGQIRGNTTMSNMVVSSSFREKDEIVAFKVDSKQARVIEVLPSTPTKHYTDALDITGLPDYGIDKELVYSSAGGVYFEHSIDYDDIVNTSYTIPQNSILIGDNNNTIIKTGMYFSIGQEFYEPNVEWLDFEFNLKTTTDGILNFKVARKLELSPSNLSKTIHSDYLKSWWIFEAWDDNDTPNDESDDILIAECYIENRTGDIVFKGSVSVEDVADNFEVVKGLKINSHSWEVHPENMAGSFLNVEDQNINIEDNNNFNFSILPNPNSGNFSIRNKKVLENARIEVYNTIGELVFKRNYIKTNTIDINLTQASKGIYFIKIFTEKNTTNKKIIIE